jgi:hypothetical protein
MSFTQDECRTLVAGFAAAYNASQITNGQYRELVELIRRETVFRDAEPRPRAGPVTAAFLHTIEQEFGWPFIVSHWTRHTTAEAKAADREEWLIDVARKLHQRSLPTESTPAVDLALPERLAKLEQRMRDLECSSTSKDER